MPESIEQIREKAPKIVTAHERLNGITDAKNVPAETMTAVSDARADMPNFRTLDRNMRELSIRTFEAQLARLKGITPRPGEEGHVAANANLLAVEVLVGDMRTVHAEQTNSPTELAVAGLSGTGSLLQRGGTAALDLSQGIVSTSGKALTKLGDSRWLSLAAVGGVVYAASRWIRQKIRGAASMAYGAGAYGISSIRSVPGRIRDWRNARRTQPTAASLVEENARLRQQLAGSRSTETALGTGYAG